MIAWITSFTFPDWMLLGSVVLAIAACGMTAVFYMITGRRRRRDDDGLDFYHPGDLAQRYREHEGWF